MAQTSLRSFNHGAIPTSFFCSISQKQQNLQLPPELPHHQQLPTAASDETEGSHSRRLWITAPHHPYLGGFRRGRTQRSSLRSDNY